MASRKLPVVRQQEDAQIAYLVTARTALQEATTVPQVKKIHDAMASAEVFARRQQLSEETIGLAHSIKYEALGKLGDMLIEMPKAQGGQPYQRHSTGSNVEPVETLEDLGLDKKTSMIAQQLAGLDAATRRQIAQREMSLAEAMRAYRKATKVYQPLPPGLFRVLYADPPWSYRNSGAIDAEDSSYGRAAKHYPTMTIDDLCDLPVRERVAENAVLFLWVTAPLLEECQPVIPAWGFEYKTSIVWNKDAHNYGHYVSVQHEHLLICTRGSCLPDHPAPMPPSIVKVRRTRKHSEKPEEFRQIIHQLYDGDEHSRLELFGRKSVPGWTVYGNEFPTGTD